MGVLTSAELIEISASELIGQYKPETAPINRRKVESVLGKVVFIDKVYRLGVGISPKRPSINLYISSPSQGSAAISSPSQGFAAISSPSQGSAAIFAEGDCGDLDTLEVLADDASKLVTSTLREYETCETKASESLLISDALNSLSMPPPRFLHRPALLATRAAVVYVSEAESDDYVSCNEEAEYDCDGVLREAGVSEGIWRELKLAKEM
ncbi:hypothetical protein BDZ91DRAFT_802783 [Kalaharituber pfeilii]|nr:hypothetical protein BDZ91DRAFT_802783 [Kalaharituber pfeilii]